MSQERGYCVSRVKSLSGLNRLAAPLAGRFATARTERPASGAAKQMLSPHGLWPREEQ
jgi:hypothetical protein